MVDINFSNKTLAFGVIIALILSYGMVNFNGGAKSSPVMSTASAITQAAAAGQKMAAVDEDESSYGSSRRRHYKD